MFFFLVLCRFVSDGLVLLSSLVGILKLWRLSGVSVCGVRQACVIVIGWLVDVADFLASVGGLF